MSKMPEFDPYPAARPPRYGWWFASLIVLLVILANLPWEGYGGMVLLPLSIVVLGLWLIAFLVEIWAYSANHHDAQRFAKQVKQLKLDWQARYRRKAALVEAVLVEVTCSTVEVSQDLFGPYRQPANPAEPRDWIATHYGAVSGVDNAEHERQAAKLLAVQWSVQQAEPVVLQPLRCYWLGSQDSWEAFAEEMAQVCPEVRLPAHPEPWQGIGSLYAIIDQLQGAPDDAFIFCGGCQSLPTLAHSPQPEKAAALLWIFGAEGRLLFSRGEWLVPAAQGAAPMVQSQPHQYGRTALDQICVSFAEPYVPRPYDIDWRRRKDKEGSNIETLDDLPDMISMTQAALSIVRRRRVASWRGRYPQRPPVLGIVMPNDSTEAAKSAAPVAP
ncbi:hypothetical protein M2401_006901 [Pseudomonas sp. JUb42]|uniref:hypothetical protein n=1 Tax=Pseudomonas sp. JUb42 TaxID=2940611 RepID=UPI002167BEEC|nr:hypothetical protein [Pseudomonas sp. JUb42]MCS3473133.1 hypothetical protein [Pseudomonas sp. JUb42]